jgi:hypothetical protein
MGPDEFATRHELELIVRYLFAKSQQQVETVAHLMALLIAKGIVTEAEFDQVLRLVRESETSRSAKRAHESLREYGEIRDILRNYEEPPPGGSV